MKNNLQKTGWLLLALVFLGACQKDSIVPATQNAATNPLLNKATTTVQSLVVETAPPIQTPQYISINANIGGFYQALPAKYSSTTQKYPLMIFCHGIGELGNGSASQLPRVLRNGPPKLINNKTFPPSFTVNGNTYSFIVISPQFKAWPQPADIQAVINYAIAHYRVDLTRIYLTGLSMGGGVTWSYPAAGTLYASRLAAILPIAGAAYPEPFKTKPISETNLATWALQNQYDPTVPSWYSVDFVKYINAYIPTPNPKAILTLFNASGHDSWDEAYNPAFKQNNMNVYQWMLQYSRPKN
ncbi:MAG TPA: hypothetical protein VNE41_07800 [Chitinophagaceae bacterium]|nr:hypothetical protein [Chitinophagaceae bacterium]